MPLIRPYDKEELRDRFRSAQPFPHIVIDEFLDTEFCSRIAGAYPSYIEATEMGFEFDAFNEKSKIQVSDSARFAGPIKKLSDCLASEEFLDDLSFITGIPRLLADETLAGGGMHLTGPGGRLDVHIDFNYVESNNVHRRLNILLYFNEGWDSNWGGQLELWDGAVRECHRVVDPQMNRCVIFQTSDISFHGVRPIKPDAGRARKSFAAYYYTTEPPEGWTGEKHSTVFKSRPEEVLRGYVGMPLRLAMRIAHMSIYRAKQFVKRVILRR